MFWQYFGTRCKEKNHEKERSFNSLRAEVAITSNQCLSTFLLTLAGLFSRRQTGNIFFLFSQKIDFDVSCRLSPSP